MSERKKVRPAKYGQSDAYKKAIGKAEELEYWAETVIYFTDETKLPVSTLADAFRALYSAQLIRRRAMLL